jgi:hypothetical protein
MYSHLKERKTNKTVGMMEQPWAKRCCWVYYIHLNSFARPISIRRYRVCYTNPGANYLCNGEFVFRSTLAFYSIPYFYISFPSLPFKYYIVIVMLCQRHRRILFSALSLIIPVVESSLVDIFLITGSSVLRRQSYEQFFAFHVNNRHPVHDGDKLLL